MKSLYQKIRNSENFPLWYYITLYIVSMVISAFSITPTVITNPLGMDIVRAISPETARLEIWILLVFLPFGLYKICCKDKKLLTNLPLCFLATLGLYYFLKVSELCPVAMAIFIVSFVIGGLLIHFFKKTKFRRSFFVSWILAITLVIFPALIHSLYFADAPIMYPTETVSNVSMPELIADHSKPYKEMTGQERLNAVYDLISLQCKEFDIAPPKVSAKNLDTIYTKAYTSGKEPHDIVINTFYLVTDEYTEALKTAMHECYHYYQFCAIEGLCAVSEQDVQRWASAKQGYPYNEEDYEKRIELYTFNPLEVDARAYANEFIDKYDEYIDNYEEE